MPKRTYTAVPQRVVKGAGYIDCQPHQADRIAIVETTHIPAKLGRRSQQLKRVVEVFRGAGAARKAADRIDILTRASHQPRRKEPGIYARSLTRAEYDALVDSGDVKPAVRPRWNEFSNTFSERRSK